MTKYNITITGVECADEREAARFAERFSRSLPHSTPWERLTWEEAQEEPQAEAAS